MSPARRFQQGFSLLELSIAIAIMSILVVMGLEGMALYLNRTAYQTTRQKLMVIDAALVEYRRVYERLPCPAQRHITTAINGYGKENCAAFVAGAPPGGNGVTGTTNVRVGTVPVRDLNLPLSYMIDGYGNRIAYLVTRDMTTNAVGYANVATVDAIQMRTGRLEPACGGACQILGDAAYVLISNGGDRRGARGLNGGNAARPCLPTPTTTFDGRIDSKNCIYEGGTLVAPHNTIPANAFYDSRYNTGSVEQNYFDDVVIWRSKSQL